MQTKAIFSAAVDDDMYPETPEQLFVPWVHFTVDFWSKDRPVTKEILGTCDYYSSFQIDFRSYLIENPVSVFTSDSIQNCVDLMRNMYLRHLIVLSPSNGDIKGIITRQDLFKWLDL